MQMPAMFIVNIAFEVFCSFLCLVFILCILLTDTPRSATNRAFLMVLVCNIAVMLSDALAFSSIGKPHRYNLIFNYIGNYCTYLFSYLLIIAFSYYITIYFSTKAPVKRTAFYAVCVVQGIAVVLSVVALFNGMYFIIDEGNVYHRQNYYWLSQALGMAGMLINAGLIIRLRRHLNRAETVALCSYIILPVIAIIIQTLVYGLVSVYIASTITITLIYLNIQAQQGRILKEKELALMESRISTMLSQIQPHFLHNALLSISELYDINPGEAKASTLALSRFLRANMDSLTETRPIPFERELGHVKSYLFIEEKRFEERLRVVYDIDVTDFLLPALTVQPIVENAVRWGITKREEGGVLEIRTWQTHKDYRIAVKDNGVGFDAGHDPLGGGLREDGKKHIGIENVRYRLKTICNGELRIDSEPGMGTVTTIIIPKERVS